MNYFEPVKYRKDESFDPIYKTINVGFFTRSAIIPAILPALAVFIILTQFVIPFVFFKTATSFSKPISQSVLGYAAGFSEFEFVELGANAPSFSAANVPKYFYLTIPKLSIEKAAVETNPTSLSPDEALGHYPGSALPGEVGNIFIYGHSVLPFFYNPKNYKTIFSTLDKLVAGDKFTINYNNKDYKYVVEGFESLKPELVNPLAKIKPAYLNEYTVVLMTCIPPGTKLERLLVKATLVR